MWLRNGGRGFGVVTEVLRWPTVLVVVAQFGGRLG